MLSLLVTGEARERCKKTIYRSKICRPIWKEILFAHQWAIPYMVRNSQDRNAWKKSNTLL